MEEWLGVEGTEMPPGGAVNWESRPRVMGMGWVPLTGNAVCDVPCSQAVSGW